MIKQTTLIVVILVAGWLAYEFSRPEEILVSQPPKKTGDKYLDDLEYLTWIVQENWSWLKMRQEEGLSLETLKQQAIQSLPEKPTDKDFLRVVTKYVAALKDGHASVRLSGVEKDRQGRWPISLVETADGLMVDGIDPVTFIDKSLDVGDLVLKVNGESIESLIEKRMETAIGSTPLARRRRAIFNLTKSSSLKTLDLLVHRRGKKTPERASLKWPLPDAPVPRRSWKLMDFEIREINEDTAYFRPGSFSCRDSSWSTADPAKRPGLLEAQFAEYRDFFQTAVEKKNLILDLRGNSGGTDLLGKALCLHLLGPGFRYYRLSAKIRGKWNQVKWSVIDDIGYGLPRFTGEVVCLIDEESFSTTDNVASCLRDNHKRITFIGRNTGGGSGAPRSFVLPSTGTKVWFCTMRVLAPDGKPIEGRGVKPDLYYMPSRDDRLAKKDGAIALALRTFEAKNR